MTAPRIVVLPFAFLLLAPATSVLGQSAENVAVVINTASADSRRIGEHYASVRNLPVSNILRIETTTDDAIDRDAYVRTIEVPLAKSIARAGLQDRLLYLVLTKGVPLRINGTTGLTGTQASVDSELTLMYRRLTGRSVDAPSPVENPYFLGTRELTEARPFSHRDHDIYLVTRLDAFSVEEALALIDRAQAPRATGTIVLDQRAGSSDARSGDAWLQRAAERLTAQQHESRVLLETTAKAARDVPEVLGRYAWGAGDPEQRTRRTGMTFVPNAIAASLASFDARTFRQPPDTWQPTHSSDKDAWFEGSADTLVGDLIRDGVTGVSGQVGEAYLLGAVRPEILFPAYLAGFTLAEAFYLATPVLSWQTVIVGDPLCAPFGRKRLTRADLEDPVDQRTGLTGLVAARRVEAVSAAHPRVPHNAVVASVRAMTMLERDDKAAAADALNEAAKLAPGMPAWLAMIASTLEEAGAYDQAIANYREVLTLQPTNIVVMNNLAYVLAVHREAPAEALPIIRKAAALAPRAGAVIDTLAWTEHLLGNHDTAATVIADALRFEPRNPEIRLHAALIYAGAGMLERAQSELDEALRLNKELDSRDDVRQLRARLRTGK